MVAMLLLTIALSSAIFSIEQKTIKQVELDNQHSLMSEARNIQVVQLASNIRSLVNIANGIEFDRYELGSIQSIDRFTYLSGLIQSQAQQLSETHEFISKQRLESQRDGNLSLAEMEYSNIELFRLDSSNKLNVYKQPYRVALSTFLNNILVLNNTDGDNLILQSELLKSSPLMDSRQIFNATTFVQKTVFFLISNGLRTIRTWTEKVTDFQRSNFENDDTLSLFVIVMILGLLISTFSILAIFYQIWVIERNKGEILSLYAYLTMKDIGKVYSKCVDFMGHLDENKLQGQSVLEQEAENQRQKEINQDNPNEPGFEGENPQLFVNDMKQTTRSLNFFGGYNQRPSFAQSGGQPTSNQEHRENYSQMSEEEKEAINFRRFIQRKRFERMNGGKQKTFKGPFAAGFNSGNDTYLELIKKNFEQINEREEELRQKHKQEYIQEAKSRQQLLLKQQDDPSNDKKDRIAGDTPTEEEGSKKKKKSRRRRLKDVGKSPEEKPDAQVSNKAVEESQDSDEDEGKKRAEKVKIDKELKDQQSQRQQGDMNREEVEERKKNFFRTIKSSNWGTVIVNGIVGLVFIGYFIQLSLLHQNLSDNFDSLRHSIPLFFDRYRNIILSYTLMKERIINNNSLSTYSQDPSYGFDLDQKFMDDSTRTEQKILQQKTKHITILQPVIDFIFISDSEKFCSDIIGLKGQIQSEKVTVTNEQLGKAKRAYEKEISGVIAANIASEAGSVKVLQALRDSEVDLNSGDYDRRTPLHTAVRAEKFDAVRFLVNTAQVKVNQVDRWGATPLSYALKGSETYLFLMSRGAQVGATFDKISVRQVILEENYYRLFFAAQQNDVPTLQALDDQILDYNIQDSEGRTPLAVAASEGNLETVKYLLSKGALQTIEDARGNSALADAQRESRAGIVEIFKSQIYDETIIQYCSQLSDGIFKKGVLQAIGNFRKRFQDIQIKVTSKQATSSQRLSVLQGSNRFQRSSLDKFEPSANSMQTYFQAQELYVHRVIDKLTSVIDKTFMDTITSYNSIVELIFLIFLIIQIIILLFLRGRLIEMMKEDVFQSRGILNLIPDDFFEQNRQSVEKLINKLKN